MPGLSDYSAEYLLNWMTGAEGSGSRYMALFTTAPNDSGSGGTEVSGGGYARVQVAGTLAAGASWTTSLTTITLGATAPAWLLALGVMTNGTIASPGGGANVYDTTNSQQIGTISSVSGTTITLTATAAHASSGSSDTLAISAFPLASASSGSEPSTTPANVTNGAQVNFAQATGTWSSGSTIPAFGLYDALTSGDMLASDYLGAFKWIPFTGSGASPCVLTCDTTSDAPANSSTVVVTSKFGGTLPPTGGSWAGLLTTANLSGATFTAGVNTTGIGGGTFRQVTSYGPIGNAAYVGVPASDLTLSAA